MTSAESSKKPESPKSVSWPTQKKLKKANQGYVQSGVYLTSILPKKEGNPRQERGRKDEQKKTPSARATRPARGKAESARKPVKVH